MTYGQILSKDGFTGSAWQLDKLRQIARDWHWGEPIENPEETVDALMPQIEQDDPRDDDGNPCEAHPEAMAFLRARLIESAERTRP